MKITETKLKSIISETVKKVLMETMQIADPMNAVSVKAAQVYGFNKQYEGLDGGYEIWCGPLPKTAQAKKIVLQRLGIDKFTSEDRERGLCTITVDPSNKNLKSKNQPLSKEEIESLASDIKTGKIKKNQALKMLVRAGYHKQAVEDWITWLISY